MKILITSDWYVPMVNGVVASVLNLKNELEAEGNEVRILTLSNTKRSHKEGNIYYMASINMNMVYPNARLRITHAHKFIKEIIAWRPDVVHSQCEFSTFHIARIIAEHLGVPFIHTYHTVYEDYTHYLKVPKRVGMSFAVNISRITANEATAVIVPTAKVKAILDKYHVKSPMFIIPSGIDTARFSADPGADWIAEKKKELGIPKDNFVIVAIGRLAKEKNLEEVISFLPGINSSKVTFLVVGGGPYEAVLKTYAAEHASDTHIVFAGMAQPKNVWAYYHLGDVFVSASTSETQGLTYFEALSAGVPCICKKDPCLDGVVIDGENGWQYAGEEDFLSHMKELYENRELLAQMKAAAKKKALAEFGIDVFARRVEEVYRTFVKE